MIAIDTNILIYARRAETELHEEAKSLLSSLAEGDAPWAIAWPCIYEFLRVVTHPKVFQPPTRMANALQDLQSLFDSPSLTLMGEGTRHREHLRLTLEAEQIKGNLVHDAHIAALAIEHGVSEFLTNDGDFKRFTGLKVRNPFR